EEGRSEGYSSGIHLILPYAGVQDEGEYRCVASNVHGETTCSAHLHVRQRIPGVPCFTREPDSVRCAPGFTAVFEYTVAGEPCPDVQWFKGTEQLFSDARRSVAHHPDGLGSLTVWECMEEDTGLYTCRAVSALGEATCSAELLVLPEEHAVCRQSPALQHSAVAEDQTVNKKIHLECQVDEDRKVTVGWTKDGNKIPPGKDYKIYFEDKIASLEIPLAKLKDSGHYVCTASNEAGSIHCVWFQYCFHQPDPRIAPVCRGEMDEEGDSARLQCKIKGSPEIQVTWFKNNKEIRESNTHRMSFVNSVAVLDILEMKVDDSGSYSCEAVNEVGSDSCATEVVVKEPPSFIRTLEPKIENVTALAGDSITLQAVVKGSEPISVMWMKGKDIIQDDNKVRVTFEHGLATLQITGVQLSSGGKYTCVAENDAGSQSCFGELAVKGQWSSAEDQFPFNLQKKNCMPVLLMCWFLSFFSLSTDRTLPPFFTKPLKNIDSIISTSCRLDCKISGSLPMTVSWFKQDTEITSSAKYTVHFAEGSASLEIKHLDPNDAGVYICRATNSAGSKESSSTLFIKGLAICFTFLGLLFSCDNTFLPQSAGHVSYLRNCFLSMQSRATQLHCRT
uniref:Ig-like domain-containing protein n=1 Tax=Otus sunia TaxID=257818 RepID=A0A8C8ACC2_9STRI